LTQSALTAELVPMSHNVSQTAAIGLSALDVIERHGSSNAEKHQLSTLKSLEAPQAVLLNMIVRGVETLVSATKP
jgi:hexosaminidase